MPPLDHDRCYAAASSRDARFDGWFVTAVRTTGIYCRPSCPAITPKRGNVEFHHTPAAAQQRGFRACKRCRPDATPGSPDWNVRHDVVARAMRLISDGIVERDGVRGLADQLGYSERHLTRLMTDEVGAGPLAVARAQRAQTARLLIETTDLRLTDVAFAAGFGSVRQFNDTIRAVFDASPTDLRRGAPTGAVAGGVPGAALGVSLRLPTRAPFAVRDVFDFLRRRAVPGLEDGAGDDGVGRYRRVLALPGGPALATLRPGVADVGAPHIQASLRLSDWGDLGTAVQRLRRLLDLDADPVAVDGRLSDVAELAPQVAAHPGLRAPASVDPFETAVRAVIGQQISVAGARTVTAGLVSAVGTRLAIDDDHLTHAFPAPELLAEAPDDAFAMPGARRDTIRRLARAVSTGTVELGVGADRGRTRSQLLAVKGIGPWTADYVLMRGLGDPDVALSGDLGVRHGLVAVGVDNGADLFDRCAPWRSYAVHHLWIAANGSSSAPAIDRPPSTSIETSPSPAPTETSRSAS